MCSYRLRKFYVIAQYLGQFWVFLGTRAREFMLDALTIKTLSQPGDYYDKGKGGVKRLFVSYKVTLQGTESKTFKIKLTIKGRAKGGGDLDTTRTIGSFDEVSLEKARKTGRKWRKWARKGFDPKERDDKVLTFEELAASVLERDADTRGDQRNAEIESWLTRWFYPVIGAKKVNKISGGELAYMLAPLHKDIPASAKDLTNVLRIIFNRAVARKYIKVNPINDAFIDDLPKIPQEDNPLPALPYSELSSAMEKIDQTTSVDIAVRSLLKAIILTGLRARSARLGEWSELFWKEIKTDADWNKKEGWLPVDWDDLESGRGRAIIWVIPKERMKGKKGKRKSHRVPVSTALLDILVQMRDVIEKEGRDPKFIFSNSLGRSNSKPGPIRHKWLVKLCRKLDLPSDVEGRHAVTHGFRSTIRDWCAEKHVPFELAEAVLVHRLPKVVRAYLRSDVVGNRARLMQAWSDYATGILPGDWKWSDLDNETLRLIAALTQRAERAEKELSEYKEQTEARLIKMDEKLSALLAA